MSFQPVGDSVTIARLAYDLYSKGFLVARHAPEDFRVLLKELKIIKNLLGLVQAKLRNNDDLFDNYAGEVLQHCREALLEFKPLVIKYEMLADTNRGLWIRRFQWATDQHRIKSCREKFSYYQSYLQLVLIPGTKQERARILDQNALQIDSNREGAPGTEAHEGERASGHPGASSPRRTSIDLIGTELGSRAQEDPDEPVPASQLDVRRWLRDLLWFPAPVDVPPVDDPQLESEGLDTLGSLSAKLNPNREKHDASSYIRNQFLKALEDIETETDVEALLRLATWWLLKSRVVQDALKSVEAEDAEQRTNNHQAPWSSNINAMQSYIDLLKASFIVEDVVLTESRSSETLIDATWIMLKNLSDSIHRDLAEWRSERSVPSIPNDNRISDFDLSFFETFLQPMENPRRLPVALDK